MTSRREMIIYAVSDLLGMAVSVVLSPLTTRLLTQRQYGAMPTFIALWTVIALFAYGGMESAYQFFRAQESDPDERLRITSVASIVATATLSLVLTLFGLVIFVGDWFNQYVGVDQTEKVLFVIWLIPYNLLTWYLFLLRFNRQFIAFTRVTLIGRVLSSALVIPAYLITPQEQRLAVMLVVQTAVQFIAVLMALFELRNYGAWPYRPKLFSSDMAWKMLVYGLTIMPGAVIYAVADVADRLLVGWFAGPAQVAVVALALSVRAVVLVFSKWFGIIWDPHLVEWLATKDSDLYLPKLQTAVNMLSVVFFCAACLLAIWIDWLIRVVYPPAYIASARLIPFFAIAAAYSTISRVAIATVLIGQKPKYYLTANVIGLFSEVVVGLILIPIVGALGAAVCTMAQELAILLTWLWLGKVRLANLPIRWHFMLTVAIVATIFVGLYTPQHMSFGANVLWSTVLLVPCAIHFYQNRSVLGLRFKPASKLAAD